MDGTQGGYEMTKRGNLEDVEFEDKDKDVVEIESLRKANLDLKNQITLLKRSLEDAGNRNTALSNKNDTLEDRYDKLTDDMSNLKEKTVEFMAALFKDE
jgi:chromosome segregation ATPase